MKSPPSEHAHHTDAHYLHIKMLTKLSLFLQQLETWTAVVVYHPWYSPQYEILSLKRETPATQQGHHHSTDKVGAPVPLEDVHDEYVLAAAEVVITELNERSNSLFETILVKVLHGTAQVCVLEAMCMHVCTKL